MPTMLMLDTCGSFGGVAIAAWDEAQAPPHSDSLPSRRILAERILPGRETQERLMTALGEVLQEATLRPVELDVLAVVAGPGSFTGVRIGMAAVKGLAESLAKPVVAVSRLAVLAAQAGSAGPVWAWIDAGRGDVFAGHYRDGVCLGETMLHGTDAIAGVKASEMVIVMEDNLPELRHGALRVAPVSFREALPLAVLKAGAKQFADVALLDANYLRVPDAELAQRARAIAAATEAPSAL
jgi:tRNA threonylcarbamoyladenosine biosynthesis protein TsaB